jgi:hypothetical protein
MEYLPPTVRVAMIWLTAGTLNVTCLDADSFGSDDHFEADEVASAASAVMSV